MTKDEIEKADERGEEQRLDIIKQSEAGGRARDPLAVIDERNKLWDRLLGSAVLATNPSQWIDMGGTPYPTAPAAEVMGRRCAVSLTKTVWRRLDRSDDEGGFFIIEYTGVASLPGGLDVWEAIGTASSRDDFLGTGVGYDKDGASKMKPLSQINEGSIIKKAYSNLEVNAVTRLLGLRHVTWEQLAKFGIKREEAGKVSFRSGAKGGGSGQANDLMDEPVKFGRAKGTAPRKMEDADLAWYLKSWEEDLANPEKEQYHKRTTKLIAGAKALQAQRANERAGTAGKPADAPPKGASPYQRILAIGKEFDLTEKATREAIAAYFPEIRGKKPDAFLKEEHVKAFREQLVKEDRELNGSGPDDGGGEVMP